MPSKKKKKPIANPARGFATVSLPSKQKSEASKLENDVSTTPQESLPDGRSTSLVPDNGRHDGGNDNAAIADMSPEALERHLENADLQDVVDAHGVRLKADVIRQVARLETERRTLRLNANKLSTSIWMPDQLVLEIIQTYQAEMENLPCRKLRQNAVIDEGDLTIKAWTLRRTLLSLGLPRVDEAMKHVLLTVRTEQLRLSKDYVWGLGEALEWYAADDCIAGLLDYESGTFENQREPGTLTESRPGSPILEEGNDPTMTREQKAVVPIGATQPIVDEVNTSSEDETDASEDDNDPAKLIDKWMRLKTSALRIEHLESSVRDRTYVHPRTRKLQARIATIESDILFDSHEAEQAWTSVLPQKFAKIRFEKDNKPSKLAPSLPSRLPREVGEASNSDGEARLHEGEREMTEEDADSQADHDENNDIFGDMFAAAEAENPTSETLSDPKSETVRLIDFGKWTGLHPRRILEEACKSRDKRSRIQISLLTNTANSFRHKVTINWSSQQPQDQWLSSSLPEAVCSRFSRRMTELQMQGIAALTELQSESYVSTIALFALSLTVPGQQKANLRIPPVWRDLWQDLVQSRQRVIDEADKSDLRHIRGLIEQSTESIKENLLLPSRRLKGTEEDRQVEDKEYRSTAYSSLDSSQIKAIWASKADTPSFHRMSSQRAQLPVSAYRQEILETVQNQSISILSAETGAGKSTQVPSFILENEMSSGRDCRILVTQPRRVSAITLARRVSQELGEAPSDLGTRRSLVGYSIRLESKVSPTTRITFATTGVLLRMLESSVNLEDLDYLMLDEVHERTMDLDLLFIAVRHLIKRRPSLKVVLMSATVDSQKFAAYFGDAPVLSIPGRTFPVEIEYLEEAIAAVGQYPSSSDSLQEITEDDIEASPENIADGSATPKLSFANFYEYRIDYDLITKLIVAIATKPEYIKYSKAILIFLPGIAEIRRLYNQIGNEPALRERWIVHMLHSSFSSEDLERAFMIPPKGVRKIVIATNIAETGITIPDITAVIDSCKEKVMRFDDRRQMSKLSEGFISRAASRQRRGRAARVQEGLCFHLVSKSRYDNLMLEQQVPEMLRLSLQDAILKIKIWNLGEIEETLAQALDPPTHKNIQRATTALKDAGALTASELLTPLGRQVARLPLDVSLSKLAILGIALRSLDAAISITAILSSKSPFIVSPNQKDFQSTSAAKATFARGNSDLLTIYNAYLAWQRASTAPGGAHLFCRKHKLSAQILSQVEEQKIQLLVQLVDAGLLHFTEPEKISLRHGRISHNGNRFRTPSFFVVPDRYNTLSLPNSTNDAGINAIIAAAFYPKLLTRQGRGWRNVSSNQQVYLLPTSINKLSSQPPKWLSFYEAMQTKSGHLNALETSAVPEAAIVTLLGEAEFKIHAGVILLDGGRVRFRVREWRTIMALKVLRERLRGVLERYYQNAGGVLGEREEKWFGFWCRAVQAVEGEGLV